MNPRPACTLNRASGLTARAALSAPGPCSLPGRMASTDATRAANTPSACEKERYSDGRRSRFISGFTLCTWSLRRARGFPRFSWPKRSESHRKQRGSCSSDSGKRAAGSTWTNSVESWRSTKPLWADWKATSTNVGSVGKTPVIGMKERGKGGRTKALVLDAMDRDTVQNTESTQISKLGHSPKLFARYVEGIVPVLNAGNVAIHTNQRLDAFVDGVVGKRITYKEVIA